MKKKEKRSSFSLG